MKKKNFVWNLIGSTFNAFTSLFYMIIVTRINGVDIAGIFTFAFSFACLIQVIGNYFGRSYQVTNLNDDISDSDFIYSRFFTCFLMAIFTLFFLLNKDYSEYKLIVIVLLVIFRMIESFGEILYGIIQKKNRLYQVGISMFLKGLVSVLLFFLFDYFTHNLLLAVLFISVVNLAILLFYDYKNVKNSKIEFKKFNKENLKKIMYGGFFVFVFTFLTQYVLNASKYSIDNFLPDNFQTIYGIIVMPATVMALCAQFLVQPFLITITDFLKKGLIKNFISLVVRISSYIVLLGIAAEMFCYFFGIPILEIIYGIKLQEYRLSLMLIIGGSVFFAISYVISNSLIALRKNFIQAVIYAVTSLVAFFVSNILVKSSGVFGAAMAYFAVMLVLLVLYIIAFYFATVKFKKTNNIKNSHTFVVLAYNESKFLEDCVKSVLNQSVKTNVLIATTTRNRHIEEIAKKYNLEIVEGKHTTIGGDFDFALNCVNTKLVTIAHQDDIYEYNYAEKIIDNYNKYSDAIIIFSDYYEIRGNKKIYTNLNLKIKRFLLSSLWSKQLSKYRFFKRNALRFGCSICCPAVTFVKENCPKSVFSSDFKSNVDWFAWENLSKLNGRFIYLSEKLMAHRIDISTTTTEIINKGIRTKEDLIILDKFWPKKISLFVNKCYRFSENSNKKR